MKKIVILSAGLLLSTGAFAQIKIGQAVPDVRLTTVLNAPEKATGLESLNGKVIWLEFWATWCSPCVEAMPQLQALQKQFAGKLQVIAISTEKEKRISQFIGNKPSNLWFDVDTADSFREFFPYHTIPHSVLIDKSGQVVAITEPGNINAKVISDVIAGRQINLPVKADNMDENPIETWFHAADTAQSRFWVQPEIKGISSMYKSYTTDRIFKNRRATMMNLTLEAVYRIAYNNLPYGRVIDLTRKENIKQNKTKYCIDIIVPKGHESELMSTLRRELEARFDLRASIEQRTKSVYILKVADTVKLNRLKRSVAGEETFAASHGAFNGEGITLRKIADYLEGFGLVTMPVVDETGLNTKYDIAFDYQPEKDGSLTDAINSLGLKLETGDREIDMLVFR